MNAVGGIFLATLLGGLGARAGALDALVVIVHPDSGVTRMTREEAGRIFLGRQKRLASGLVALAVEPTQPDQDRARFYRLLVALPLPQVRSYWAQLYFSGQAQPPRQVSNGEEVVEIVSANRGAVGFVERARVTPRVRAVLTLEDPPGDGAGGKQLPGDPRAHAPLDGEPRERSEPAVPPFRMER